jgi:hypothetical protein
MTPCLYLQWEIQRHFGMAIRGEHIKSFEHVDHCVNFVSSLLELLYWFILLTLT